MGAEPLLTTEEVAALLRVHPKQVYRLLRRGLPARRVGSEWRFSRDDVLSWSGARGAEPRRVEASVASEAPAPPPLLAANGDISVELLLRLVRDRGEPLLGLVQTDLGGGLRLLEHGAVLASGVHAGAFPAELTGDRLARIHLVEREVGIVAARGSPVPPLSELRGRRLASRAPSAGIRVHFDAALRRAGVDPALAHEAALLLDSHLEVAAAVASGRADAGIASCAWADRLGLPFRPLAREAYGLLVRARHLGDPRVVRLCEAAQSSAYRRAAGAIAGYDATGAGDIRYDAA